MSGFLAVCVWLSLHRGREWEGEVSKWFLFYVSLVFSRSFVHDCKTAKCFQNQGEPKFGQIRAKSKAGLKFDIRRLCSQTFNYYNNIGVSCTSLPFTLHSTHHNRQLKNQTLAESCWQRWCTAVSCCVFKVKESPASLSSDITSFKHVSKSSTSSAILIFAKI